MKYIKLLAILLGMTAFASCGYDDDKPDTNTASGVTVSMETADISFMESRGIVRIPVEVKGDANGYVTVTCEVDETGYAAIEDAHYMMTSKTINIAPGDNTGYFEVRIIDDRVINEGGDRQFTITLVNAQGASISGITETLVTIKDNDAQPYDRLGGEWYVSCLDSPGGNPITKIVNIIAYDPDEYGYGYSYEVEGLVDGCNIMMMFHYEEATQEGDVTIKLGQTVSFEGATEGQTFELDGIDDAVSMPITSGNVTLTWNEDASELLLVSSPMGGEWFNLLLLDNNWSIYGYVFGVTKFTREKP